VKVGEVIDGRYELEELVGRGGMSGVYRARDTVLEREVAIKLLDERFSHDDEYVERFRREARAIARLAHPNVVTIIDRGNWDGRQYIVFEYVRGENLKELLRREGPLPVGRGLSLAYQIAQALASAHALGIVHRDVKPQNILLDEDGAAKVTDFGIARSLELEADLTQTGTMLGTADYLAPEQAAGERVDERADQYSLGAVLYELLTGDVPFPAPNAMAAALRHLHDPVPSVRYRRPDVPARVDALVGRALAKRPVDRFASMEEMGTEVRSCAEADGPVGHREPEEDTGVLAPAVPEAPVRPRPQRQGRAKRGPRLVIVALVLAAGLGIIAGLFAWQIARDNFPDGVPGFGGDESSASQTVRLRAHSDFDPEGGDGEHPEAVRLATDGDSGTFWSTETYRDFAGTKSGVGIVLAARGQGDLEQLVVRTDEPGFTAIVRAATGPRGPFEDVSEAQEVGRRTTFEIDTDGEDYRYYLVWITDLDGSAHVNEVRAA
jgi:eukaryotic-like serine/threonine-protein kinase